MSDGETIATDPGDIPVEEVESELTTYIAYEIELFTNLIQHYLDIINEKKKPEPINIAKKYIDRYENLDLYVSNERFKFSPQRFFHMAQSIILHDETDASKFPAKFRDAIYLGWFHSNIFHANDFRRDLPSSKTVAPGFPGKQNAEKSSNSLESTMKIQLLKDVIMKGIQNVPLAAFEDANVTLAELKEKIIPFLNALSSIEKIGIKFLDREKCDEKQYEKDKKLFQQCLQNSFQKNTPTSSSAALELEQIVNNESYRVVYEYNNGYRKLLSVELNSLIKSIDFDTETPKTPEPVQNDDWLMSKKKESNSERYSDVGRSPLLAARPNSAEDGCEPEVITPESNRRMTRRQLRELPKDEREENSNSKKDDQMDVDETTPVKVNNASHIAAKKLYEQKMRKIAAQAERYSANSAEIERAAKISLTVDRLRNINDRFTTRSPGYQFVQVVEQVKQAYENTNELPWLHRFKTHISGYVPFPAPLITPFLLSAKDEDIYGDKYHEIFDDPSWSRRSDDILRYIQNRFRITNFGRFPLDEVISIRDLCDAKHHWDRHRGIVTFADKSSASVATEEELKPIRRKPYKHENWKMFQPGDIVWVFFERTHWPAYIISLEPLDSTNPDHPKPRPRMQLDGVDLSVTAEIVVHVRYTTNERDFVRIDNVDYFHTGFPVRYNSRNEKQSYVESVADAIIKLGLNGYFEEFMTPSLYKALLSNKWSFKYLPKFIELRVTEKLRKNLPDPIQLYETRKLYQLGKYPISELFWSMPFAFVECDRVNNRRTDHNQLYMANIDLRHFVDFVRNHKNDLQYPVVFNPSVHIVEALKMAFGNLESMRNRDFVSFSLPTDQKFCCNVAQCQETRYPHWRHLALSSADPPTLKLNLKDDEYPPKFANVSNKASLSTEDLKKCYRYARELRAKNILHEYFEARRANRNVPEPRFDAVEDLKEDEESPNERKNRSSSKRQTRSKSNEGRSSKLRKV